MARTTISDDLIEFWRVVWKARVPDKVKFFMWRAWNNYIPTVDNLQSCGLNQTSSCTHCGETTKSIVHVMFKCSTTKEELSMMILWGLWTRRNKHFHGQLNGSKGNMETIERLVLSEYHKANQREITSTLHNTHRGVWLRTEIDVIKVNCDADWKNESRKAGLGFVARDYNGEIVAGHGVGDFSVINGHLDKFEGHDFRRWQKKMHFLLTTLKVVYALTTPMPELLEDATVKAIRIRAKWENDDYICMGHILNGMSGSLFDVYTNVESYKELWDSLESKYMAEDSSSKKFLDFKHTLKHGKDDLSLVQLGSHLRIEESLRAQDSDKGKGKEVGGKKRSNENNSGSGSSKKPKLECWKFGKTGHFKRDCRSGKKTTQMLVVDAIAWWIDSGATTHVCKDRCWFKTFEPVEDGSVYESDKYILSKCGVFVGFGYYNNGMFMLNLNKVPNDSDYVYMSSSSTVVNTSLWHARLGHVHYKRMLEMSKDELIPAIDENYDK
nr:hypothetical protein [Tanacetum cinerariifolium]